MVYEYVLDQPEISLTSSCDGVEENEGCSLTCRTTQSGNPTTVDSYTWIFNSKFSEFVLRTLHETSNTLVIGSAQYNDSGTYECVAHHEAGDVKPPSLSINVSCKF